MANLGAVGRSRSAPRAHNFIECARAQAKISGSGAEPGASIVISRRTAQVAAVVADSAGAWVLASGLNDGTYWASELGSPRGWSIMVAGASVTVTLEEGSGGGDTITAGYAFGWQG